jgi:predicted ATPase
MRELSNAGLIYQRRSARGERYLFKHALLRDTAYESMMRSTRQLLHQRVADTLRERFPEVERTQPEVLARHFEDGGRLDSAAECWGEAGTLTLARGTYVESIRHFQQGLDLVRKLPPTLQTRRLEATLTEPLGTALVATQGYASSEVEKTFRRATTLCQELGEEVSFRVLYGIWGVHFVRSERETTAFMLERLRLHAQRTGEPISVCTAETAGGLRAFFDGDFARARDELTKATRWYGDESILEEVRRTGYDGRLYSFAYLTCALAILGHAALAEQTRDRMLALALESPNPYARAIAWTFALNLAHDTGDVDAACQFGAQAIAHATEQKLPYFLATALPVAGWALVRQGQTVAGIEQIQYGLNLFNAIGIRSFYAYYLSMLAEAYLQQGRADDGLKAVDEGLGLAQILLDRFYEAELHRLKGELLLARGDPNAAEASLRNAYDLAGRQRARLFQVRAALSLGRLLRDQGRKEDARALLGAVYPQFTDGLVAADVRRAEELFAEL